MASWGVRKGVFGAKRYQCAMCVEIAPLRAFEAIDPDVRSSEGFVSSGVGYSASEGRITHLGWICSI